MFHFKIWKSTNIFFVKDLLKEDGTFLNVQEFNQKYDIRVQYLEYLGCINVIKAYLREHICTTYILGMNIVKNILKYILFRIHL